jgi:hypothetical protein
MTVDDKMRVARANEERRVARAALLMLLRCEGAPRPPSTAATPMRANPRARVVEGCGAFTRPGIS